MVRRLRRIAPDGPRVLQLIAASYVLAPGTVWAECYAAAVVLDEQRRARQTLSTMTRHLELMGGLTAAARAVPDPTGVGGGYVMDAAYWSDVPICDGDASDLALLTPFDLSLHLHDRPFRAPLTVGAHVLMLRTSLGASGAEATTDGSRWYVGGRVAYGAWIEGAAGLIIEDEADGGPSTRTHLRLAVPALHLSASTIIGEALAEPETVLLDVDIPWTGWLSTPVGLTWREDEQRLAVSTGVHVGRWLAAQATFEDSARVLRSGRLQLALPMYGPGSLYEAAAPPSPERPADAPPPPRPTSQFALAFAVALDFSNGQALRDAIGESAWGLAIETTARITQDRYAAELRFGQSVNEASVLDDMPHLAGVSGLQMHVSLSYVWD